jgi:hypothetical protein
LFQELIGADDRVGALLDQLIQRGDQCGGGGIEEAGRLFAIP